MEPELLPELELEEPEPVLEQRQQHPNFLRLMTAQVEVTRAVKRISAVARTRMGTV